MNDPKKAEEVLSHTTRPNRRHLVVEVAHLTVQHLDDLLERELLAAAVVGCIDVGFVVVLERPHLAETLPEPVETFSSEVIPNFIVISDVLRAVNSISLDSLVDEQGHRLLV